MQEDIVALQVAVDDVLRVEVAENITEISLVDNKILYSKTFNILRGNFKLRHFGESTHRQLCLNPHISPTSAYHHQWPKFYFYLIWMIFSSVIK